MVQQKQIPLETMRLWVRSLALLSGLRIRCHCELQCRLQTRLRSGVAVALVQAGSNSSDQTPAWEPPYIVGVALKGQKTKTKTKTKTKYNCLPRYFKKRLDKRERRKKKKVISVENRKKQTIKNIFPQQEYCYLELKVYFLILEF